MPKEAATQAREKHHANHAIPTDLKREGVVTTQKLVAEHSVVMDPAYVHITARSIAEHARLASALAERGVWAVGRYGRWTYCSIEDNIVEARTLAAKLA